MYAVLNSNNVINVYEWGTSERVGSMNVRGLDLTLIDCRVLVCPNDETIVIDGKRLKAIYSLQDKRTTATLPKLQNYIVSSDGELLAAAGDCFLRVMDKTGTTIDSVTIDDEDVRTAFMYPLSFNADKTGIFYTALNRSLCLVNIETWSIETYPVFSVLNIDLNTNRCVFMDGDDVFVYDLTTKERVRIPSNNEESIYAFTNDGSVLVQVCCESNQIVLYSAGDGTELWTIELGSKIVDAVVSPVALEILIIDNDGFMIIDLESGERDYPDLPENRNPRSVFTSPVFNEGNILM
jgi:WD40 repeat protein